MASTSAPTLSISSSSTLIDTKANRQLAAASPQCVTISTLTPPPIASQSRSWKSAAYCRKIARNVVAMATGKASVEVASPEFEMLEFVKTVQPLVQQIQELGQVPRFRV